MKKTAKIYYNLGLFYSVCKTKKYIWYQKNMNEKNATYTPLTSSTTEYHVSCLFLNYMCFWIENVCNFLLKSSILAQFPTSASFSCWRIEGRNKMAILKVLHQIDFIWFLICCFWYHLLKIYEEIVSVAICSRSNRSLTGLKAVWCYLIRVT